MSDNMTLRGQVALVKGRERSAEELACEALDRAEKENLNAFITLDREGALAAAREVDARLARGEEAGILAGAPLAVKDILVTRGLRTTCGSKMLETFVPPYDATALRRLREAGAVIIGKTNMDEFAMGSSTESSALGPCRNPWDRDRVPGGSSGGSAAAVASGVVAGALGTDTGGSIRQPASFCGVTGLKPTYGRVSRYGQVAFASSLDQIGPLATNAQDCALLLQAIAGPDPLDSTSAPLDVPDYQAALEGDLRGMVVGVAGEYFGEGLDPGVEGLVRQAICVLVEAGATVKDVSLPSTPYAIPAYYLIATAEASSNLARYDGVRYGLRVPDPAGVHQMLGRTRAAGFGAEVKRRIMLGTHALSSGYYDAYYRTAQQARTLIQRDFEAAFGEVDLVVTPTSPTPAFRLGERLEDPLQMYLADIYTVPANLAGLPGLSLPCGFVEGLPVGMQILGRPFEEGRILRAAWAYQGLTGWHTRRPMEEVSHERQGV